MNRRTFLKNLGVSVAALSLTGCNALDQKASAKEKSLKGSRPNIILVMTDDQGMGDLSCLGNPVLKAPNLDKFYEMSTRFREFHISPTCSLTRSAIMSGRHEFRNGVTHTILERERMALSTTTMPQVLRTGGCEGAQRNRRHIVCADAVGPRAKAARIPLLGVLRTEGQAARTESTLFSFQ